MSTLELPEDALSSDGRLLEESEGRLLIESLLSGGRLELVPRSEELLALSEGRLPIGEEAPMPGSGGVDTPVLSAPGVGS